VTDNVTTSVRQLTELGVSRVEDFELLLAMARQPERDWDPTRITGASTLTLTAAGEAFARLLKRGLVELVRPEPPAYKLGPPIDVARLLGLRKEYERDRTRVMNAFFTCNLDSLRSFASAFRIRRS
jgi:hypothetical protein